MSSLTDCQIMGFARDLERYKSTPSKSGTEQLAVSFSY